MCTKCARREKGVSPRNFLVWGEKVRKKVRITPHSPILTLTPKTVRYRRSWVSLFWGRCVAFASCGFLCCLRGLFLQGVVLLKHVTFEPCHVDPLLQFLVGRFDLTVCGLDPHTDPIYFGRGAAPIPVRPRIAVLRRLLKAFMHPFVGVFSKFFFSITACRPLRNRRGRLRYRHWVTQLRNQIPEDCHVQYSPHFGDETNQKVLNYVLLAE